jgi:hypothetical protein
VGLFDGKNEDKLVGVGYQNLLPVRGKPPGVCGRAGAGEDGAPWGNFLNGSAPVIVKGDDHLITDSNERGALPRLFQPPRQVGYNLPVFCRYRVKAANRFNDPAVDLFSQKSHLHCFRFVVTTLMVSDVAADD